MNRKEKKLLFDKLRKKAHEIRCSTVEIHGVAPETRLASSLSAVEILVVLYYGGLLKYKAEDPQWKHRDRLIVSKGHGGISLYPILADLGFFPEEELLKVGTSDTYLGGIPDPIIPGFETVNGSLGHGLGVGCGMAVGLKGRGADEYVYVLMGDGEMFEGSVWEAVMFAGHHKLDNMILVLDNNKISMLDYCRNVIDLNPIKNKFETFGWDAVDVPGHDVEALYDKISYLKERKNSRPKILIADTVKGKGVADLENDVLCHVKSFTRREVDDILEDIS